MSMSMSHATPHDSRRMRLVADMQASYVPAGHSVVIERNRPAAPAKTPARSVSITHACTAVHAHAEGISNVNLRIRCPTHPAPIPTLPALKGPATAYVVIRHGSPADQMLACPTQTTAPGRAAYSHTAAWPTPFDLTVYHGVWSANIDYRVHGDPFVHLPLLHAHSADFPADGHAEQSVGNPGGIQEQVAQVMSSHVQTLRLVRNGSQARGGNSPSSWMRKYLVECLSHVRYVKASNFKAGTRTLSRSRPQTYPREGLHVDARENISVGGNNYWTNCRPSRPR
ncbi:hypothetical protein K505DRAFT_399835 [Melanomma pulvis-pyrius CBS 109.77]|uniref:Uncharacterized protein n=1 Tax=Melanomma pulvis-pyrius CBS 109.77 TaxID=1314802 RepID=A0A6A6XKF8_9PLEO|nr:hypothetical protein K505DRAFT_399835 [Melanomma pulvis-pyrius CBS 109.77]